MPTLREEIQDILFKKAGEGVPDGKTISVITVSAAVEVMEAFLLSKAKEAWEMGKQEGLNEGERKTVLITRDVLEDLHTNHKEFARKLNTVLKAAGCPGFDLKDLPINKLLQDGDKVK